MAASVEQVLERIKSASYICKANKKYFIEFTNHCYAKGMTEVRILKYLYTLIQICKMFNKDFKKATKEDLIVLMRKIEQKDYADWTKHDYKVIIKCFYKWLNGDEEYPDKVKWIKTTMKNGNHKLPEELLSEKDIENLIKAANNSRNRAFVFTLYESGCRIGELLSLKIKHVSFDDFGARLIVNGKTGMRRVRIIAAVPHLSAWLNDHPYKNNPNSYLWINKGTKNNGKPMCHGNVRKLLQKLANKAGINKRIFPHLFRHSRATHLAKHLTEAQMNEFFGWVQGSDMPSTYVHLSGRDVDSALLKTYGIKKNGEEDESRLKPKKCPRCNTDNPSTGKFCNKCGLPLDIETSIKVDKEMQLMNQFMNMIMKNPEIKQILIEKAKEFKDESRS